MSIESSYHVGDIINGYELLGEIDRTSRSAVFHSRRQGGNVDYALKVVDATGAHREFAEREVSILREVSSPYIMEAVDTFSVDEAEIIVMPLAAFGGLESISGKGKKTILPEDLAKVVIRTALLALQYLHSIGIWHRDIKVDNFLVTKNSDNDFSVKLADLGFARRFGENEVAEDFLGTKNYAAPEIHLRKPYDCSVDMWSLGVTMYVLLSGTFPFPTSPECAMRSCTLSGSFIFPSRQWKGISTDAKDLIEKMIKVQPDERISIKDALSHPWLSA